MIGSSATSCAASRRNMVTAVEIDEMYTNDTLLLAPMVQATAQNFRIAEVSARKATAA